MNPSYIRLQVVKEAALPRFSAWLGLPELEPPTVTRLSHAVDRAVDGSDWRGAAFFIYENEGWTIFEDMTGYLGDKTSPDWLRLAAQDNLVFAGYNDSIPYGVLVVIENREILRDFFDYELDPAQNVNKGRLDFEETHPIQNWAEAASFVDADDLAATPDDGTLWIFRTTD